MPVVEPHVMEALLAYLRSNCAHMCRHWFNEIEVIELSQGTLTLLVKEQVRLKYLQRCCVDQFTEAAQAATGRLLAVEFIGENKQVERAEDKASTGVFTQPELDEEMILSPDYTFDSFVVGPDNRLAHAASLAVAQKPGKAYNPFFVHGGVGLGKTHLLQAICQMAMRTHNGMRIFYTSCNGFMNHFMEAVQAGQMADFRHRFRNFDLLIVDDIHDLSKRGPSQEEFFHTFNALVDQGKQIVISADRAPAEIKGLEERIKSRLSCGLIVDLHPTTYELRLGILQSKTEAFRRQSPDMRIGAGVLEFLAHRISTNVRVLEGALQRLFAHASLLQREITLEVAQECLADILRTNDRKISIDDIQRKVAEHYNIRLADMMGPKRARNVARPRQIAMYLSKQLTCRSLPEIGRRFGGRDHTTIMHGVRKIEELVGEDSSIAEDVAMLKRLLEA